MTAVVDAVGWAGAGCLLLAYGLLSTGRLRAGSRFHLLNLAGAAGLAVNGAYHHAWPSAALNVVWLGIGLAATVRHTPAHTAAGDGGPYSATRAADVRREHDANGNGGLRGHQGTPADGVAGRRLPAGGQHAADHG